MVEPCLSNGDTIIVAKTHKRLRGMLDPYLATINKITALQSAFNGFRLLSQTNT